MDGGFYWLCRPKTQRVSKVSKEAALKCGVDAAAPCKKNSAVFIIINL